MKARGLKPATINREISAAADFWEWARDKHNVIEETRQSPFARQWESKSKETPRRPFTAAELNKLTEEFPLRWCILAALFSGMRAGEVATATIESDCFMVPRGKTKASRRTIPLHPALLDKLELELTAPTLTGSELSKRFTRWRRKLEIEGGEDELGFHSLRHNFATALAKTGIPEIWRRYVLGLSASGMDGTYVHGPDLDQ